MELQPAPVAVTEPGKGGFSRLRLEAHGCAPNLPHNFQLITPILPLPSGKKDASARLPHSPVHAKQNDASLPTRKPTGGTDEPPPPAGGAPGGHSGERNRRIHTCRARSRHWGRQRVLLRAGWHSAPRRRRGGRPRRPVRRRRAGPAFLRRLFFTFVLWSSGAVVLLLCSYCRFSLFGWPRL